MGFSFKQMLNGLRVQKNSPPAGARHAVGGEGPYAPFYRLCAELMESFDAGWEEVSIQSAAEIQKKAIIGYEKEKGLYMDKIARALEVSGYCGVQHPPWYRDLISAVYEENWGLAGLSQWFSEEHAFSSSAKIIGENVYFLENGRMVLKPQKISEERKARLIKAFLLLTPEERMDKSYHELYLLDGTRVTIFTMPMAKKGGESLVFRRYIVPSLSFEEQARRGTIPPASVNWFKDMARMGFNVVFAGAVRTAKTTFLSTWQAMEDDSLEGVMVETDPEIPMGKLLPGAPILQLIADGEELRRISKNLLRSDADYFILAEARDGIALDTALRIASKGTKRMKMTFHTRSPGDFPLEAATEIVKSCGGDLRLTMQKVARSFDYVFHFIQLKNKSKKKLKSIVQLGLDEGGNISADTICEYDVLKDSWQFKCRFGPAQEEYASESDPELFRRLKEGLQALEKSSPHKSEEGND